MTSPPGPLYPSRIPSKESMVKVCSVGVSASVAASVSGSVTASVSGSVAASVAGSVAAFYLHLENGEKPEAEQAGENESRPETDELN